MGPPDAAFFTNVNEQASVTDFRTSPEKRPLRESIDTRLEDCAALGGCVLRFGLSRLTIEKVSRRALHSEACHQRDDDDHGEVATSFICLRHIGDTCDECYEQRRALLRTDDEEEPSDDRGAASQPCPLP
jgi:hypothetical protein